MTAPLPFATAPAPHVVAPSSVGRVMRQVLYALVPTVALHVVFFGPGLLIQIVLGVVTALAAEAAALRLRGKPLPPFLLDGSAIITAVLLALPVAAGEHAISRDLAIAVTFLDRTINFWSIVVFGFILYLFSKRK